MTFSTYDSKTQELLLNSLWHKSLVGIAIVDKNGKILKANPALCRYTEYSESELITKTLKDITIPGDYVFDENMNERIVKGEIDSFDMPIRYITKFQRIIKVLLRSSGVVQDDEFVCFVYHFSMLENESKKLDSNNEEVFEMKHKKTFWQTIKNNWVIIAWITTTLISAISAILAVFFGKDIHVNF